MTAPYLGDIAEDATIHFTWDSVDGNGGSITRATDGTVSVYKDNGATQTTTGVTDTEDFDSLTGIHSCTIATTDAFYATGSNYSVILSAATIDGETVNATLAHFSIENRTTFPKADYPTNFSDLAITVTTGAVDSDLTLIEGTAASTEFDTLVKAALAAYKLNKLFAAASTSADVTNDSQWAQLTSKSATATNSTYDNTTDSLEALRDRGDSQWVTGTGGGGAGSGAHVVTVNVKDTAGSPANLENVHVRLVEGANTFTLLTDASGNAVFSVDAATYTYSLSKSGYQGETGTLIVATAMNVNYDIDGSSITASTGTFSTGTMTVYDETGTAEVGADIHMQVIKPPAGVDGLGMDNKIRTVTSVSAGYVEFTNLQQGATYHIWRSNAADSPASPLGGSVSGVKQEVLVPVTTPFDLTTVIGNDE